MADKAGIIIDGFPRSESQVEFIEDMFAHLSKLYASTLRKPELRDRYPKPSFKVRFGIDRCAIVLPVSTAPQTGLRAKPALDKSYFLRPTYLLFVFLGHKSILINESQNSQFQ